MNKAFKSVSSNIDILIDNIYINEIVFMVLIVLSFLGDLVGEISERAVIFYWLLVLPVFFGSTIIIEKAGGKHHKDPEEYRHYINCELILWLATVIAITMVMLLWHADSLNASTTSILIHIILANTMFVSGIILGLRFYLIGLFLFIIAALAITVQGKVAVTFMIGIPIAMMGFYLEKHYLFPMVKRSFSDVSESED